MADKKDIETITGFLDLALDIEDQMSKDVYGEFLKRGAWPADLEEEMFEAITVSLMILIKETEKHRLDFLNLKTKFLQSKNEGEDEGKLRRR